MDTGELVPDEIVIRVVDEHFAAGGSLERRLRPRRLPAHAGPQAEELEQVLAGHPLDLVLDLEVPTEIVLDRIAGRRVCENCGATLPRQHAARRSTGRATCAAARSCSATTTPRRRCQRRLELYEQADGADHRLLPTSSGSWSRRRRRRRRRGVQSAWSRRSTSASTRVGRDHPQERASRSRSMRRAGEGRRRDARGVHPRRQAGRDHARRRPRRPARCSTGAAPARTSSATTGSRRWCARRPTT